MRPIASIVAAAVTAVSMGATPAQAFEVQPTHEDMAAELAADLGKKVDADALARAFADMAEAEACDVAGYVVGTVWKDDMTLTATDLDGNPTGSASATYTAYPQFGGAIVSGELYSEDGTQLGTVNGEMQDSGATSRRPGTLFLSVASDGAPEPDAGRIIGAWVQVNPHQIAIVGGWTLCE